MRFRRTIAAVAGALTLGAGSLAVSAVLPVSAQETPQQEASASEERPWRHHRRPLLRAAIRISADAIGVTPVELGQALRDGQTVAEVAETHGVDPQDVVDALVAEAAERAETFVNHHFGD